MARSQGAIAVRPEPQVSDLTANRIERTNDRAIPIHRKPDHRPVEAYSNMPWVRKYDDERNPCRLKRLQIQSGLADGRPDGLEHVLDRAWSLALPLELLDFEDGSVTFS